MRKYKTINKIVVSKKLENVSEPILINSSYVIDNESCIDDMKNISINIKKNTISFQFIDKFNKPIGAPLYTNISTINTNYNRINLNFRRSHKTNNHACKVDTFFEQQLQDFKRENTSEIDYDSRTFLHYPYSFCNTISINGINVIEFPELSPKIRYYQNKNVNMLLSDLLPDDCDYKIHRLSKTTYEKSMVQIIKQSYDGIEFYDTTLIVFGRIFHITFNREIKDKLGCVENVLINEITDHVFDYDFKDYKANRNRTTRGTRFTKLLKLKTKNNKRIFTTESINHVANKLGGWKVCIEMTWKEFKESFKNELKSQSHTAPTIHEPIIEESIKSEITIDELDVMINAPVNNFRKNFKQLDISQFPSIETIETDELNIEKVHNIEDDIIARDSENRIISVMFEGVRENCSKNRHFRIVDNKFVMNRRGIFLEEFKNVEVKHKRLDLDKIEKDYINSQKQEETTIIEDDLFTKVPEFRDYGFVSEEY